MSNNAELLKEAILVDVFVGDLDKAIIFLRDAKAEGSNIKIEFNGKTLYSMFDNEDSCYVKCCGATKAEYEARLENWREEQNYIEEREKAERQEKIPQWKERGYKLIYPQQKEKWDRCVEVRANDIYNGVELENALQVMESLDAGNPVEQAIEIAERENHSGASWGMLMNIVANYSKRGPEFYRAINSELSDKEKEYLSSIESRNVEFKEELKNEEVF